MIICFSFDDGRSDAYVAHKIMVENGIVGTFHVTTGFIDNTFNTDSFGVNRSPLSLRQLQEMKNNGMEISSHGDKHMMNDDDFATSYRKLKEWQLVNDKVGFSVPNSDYSNDELKIFYKNNKSSISYIRVGRSSKCYSLSSKVNYALYHVLHLQCFYNIFNKHNVIEKVDRNKIVSLVIKNDIKAKNIVSFIDKYKNQKNAILVIMFHSIVEQPNNKWEWSIDNFKYLCKYLSSEKEIECLTIEQMIKQEGDKTNE